MDSSLLGVHIRFRMTSRKFGDKKKDVHFGIPRSGSLIETIKRFLKVTNKAKVILDIARRLFHVDFFLQISMQEGGFNVHMMDLPFMWGNKGKNKLNGIHSSYKGKGFIIINLTQNPQPSCWSPHRIFQFCPSWFWLTPRFLHEESYTHTTTMFFHRSLWVCPVWNNIKHHSTPLTTIK